MVLAVALLLVLGCFWPDASQASARRALVIGNAAYETSPLRNPVNDATDVSARLRELGFEVTLLTEVDQSEMERGVRRFADALGPQDVGLFYYAGHGVQAGGRNYLIPLASSIETELDLRYKAVDAGMVLDYMERAGNAINLVVLDACRNNPYRGRFRSALRGLARVDAPRGSMVLYAAQPGSVAQDGAGRNGTFTRHFLSALQTPGLKLEEVIKETARGVHDETHGEQIPWSEGILLGDFYFREGPEVRISSSSSEEPAAAVQQAGTPVLRDAEITFWESISSAEECSEYEAYLESYPSGRFGSLARARRDRFCDEGGVGSQVAGQVVGGTAGEEVRGLLSECRVHLEANRLTTGRGGNALECYGEVLRISPGNGEALRGLTEIEDRYIEWVRRDVGRRDVDRASGFLDRLKTVNAEREEVGELEGLVTRLRSELTKSAASPLPVAAATSSSASSRQSFEPEMVRVRGGCYEMGSPAGESGRGSDERQHRVCVEDYWIGKYEVTQSQWESVMGGNPSRNKGSRHPVENVSWHDVQEYIEKLNARTGREYRLPTEAEWEYACRGGGNPERYCGGSDADRVAWHSGNSGRKTHPVGGRQANGLGLYDMSGNVREWTCSEYDSGYGGAETRCASRGSDGQRALRGGSSYFKPVRVRSAYRYWNHPAYRLDLLGFRLSRTN